MAGVDDAELVILFSGAIDPAVPALIAPVRSSMEAGEGWTGSVDFFEGVVL